jgi:DNA polymerase-3 subunit beta
LGDDDTIVDSALIDGKFPQIEKIIPESHSTRVIVGREELKEAVKRALIFARDAANLIELIVEDGALTVSGDGGTGSGAGTTRQVANVEGEGMTIAVNGRFVQRILDAMEAPQVSLDLNAPTEPMVWREVGNASYLHVLMPMHSGR